MRGRSPVALALVAVPLVALACTIREIPLGANPGDGGFGTDGLADATGRDAPGGDSPIGPDAPAPSDDTAIPAPDVAAPPPDVAADRGPTCLPPMKICGGGCIAPTACCTDGDCPALPGGQQGKCDRTSFSCQYSCPAATRPCAGQCIGVTDCCTDSDCPGDVACVAKVCSTTCRAGYKRCADLCIPSDTCCRADGCCGHGDCGLCQKCSSGRCVAQGTNEDVKNECGAGTCRTGTCDGAGACGNSPDGQNGPSCAGECRACRSGECQPRTGICSTGQMCAAGSCPPRPPFALRINLNGPAHGAFIADPGVGGVCGPAGYAKPAAINGTQDDPLYESEMYGNPLLCAVGAGQLPPGPYQVVLHMAEIYWGPACAGGGLGSRVFDIEIEGRLVASRVDLFSEGGCAASIDGSGRPVIKRFMVTISDGTLNLRFPSHVDNGKLSAIEIVSAW